MVQPICEPFVPLRSGFFANYNEPAQKMYQRVLVLFAVVTYYFFPLPSFAVFANLFFLRWQFLQFGNALCTLCLHRNSPPRLFPLLPSLIAPSLPFITVPREGSPRVLLLPLTLLRPIPYSKPVGSSSFSHAPPKHSGVHQPQVTQFLSSQ